MLLFGVYAGVIFVVVVVVVGVAEQTPGMYFGNFAETSASHLH